MPNPFRFLVKIERARIAALTTGVSPTPDRMKGYFIGKSQRALGEEKDLNATMNRTEAMNDWRFSFSN
jgi:hypothetical protein